MNAWRTCLRATAMLALALCLGALAPLAAAPAPGQALAQKRVLVLSPYGYGRPGLDSFVRTYVDTLAARGVARDNILVEYLNLNRHADTDYRERARELLLMQYADKQIDLMVAVQQPAQEYLLGELATLAPDAPVIVFNTQVPSTASMGRHRILSAPPDLPVRRTLEQALRLFPDTERLIVAVGASAPDQAEKKQVEQAVATLGHPLVVEYTDGLPLAGMLARVAAAPPRSIVLLALVNRDLTGATAVPYDFSRALAKAARVPSFVQYSTMVGTGAVGGAVQHVERLAQQAAVNSVELLQGTRTLPPGLSLMPVAPVSLYDWQELKRWGVDIAALPPDSEFINRPPTLWSAHRGAVLGSAAVIAILALLAAALLLQRRRLLSAELHSRESEARFRVLVEHAPEAIVVYDAASGNLVDANTKAEGLFGCSRAELLSGGPQRFYAPDQPDGRAPAETVAEHARRAEAGEEIIFERTIQTVDGRRFPCEVSLVALPSSRGRLLRGGYVDISERKRAEQELLRHRDHLEEQVAERTTALSVAVQDAQAANRAKSVFLANMSHELRTPLNSIIGFSQIMAESTSMFDEEKRNLGIIHRSGQHLLALINDILELSRIEAGQARLVSEAVDMGTMLREVTDMVRLGADRKGVALLVECPALPPSLLLDGGKLRQVLINLLSNAVKFTERGSVTLGLAVRPRDSVMQLRFTVRDTGIGIPQDELERIFEPFMQVATAGNQAGTGLGLTISREFVQLLGGAMELRSQPGSGSEFSFAIEAALDPATQGGVGAMLPFVPPAVLGQAGAQAPAALMAGDLLAVAPEVRARLRASLQQLDMAGVAALLAAIRLDHAGVGQGIDAMLASHQYRQLCDLLDHAAAAQDS